MSMKTMKFYNPSGERDLLTATELMVNSLLNAQPMSSSLSATNLHRHISQIYDFFRSGRITCVLKDAEGNEGICNIHACAWNDFSSIFMVVAPGGMLRHDDLVTVHEEQTARFVMIVLMQFMSSKMTSLV